MIKSGHFKFFTLITIIIMGVLAGIMPGCKTTFNETKYYNISKKVDDVSAGVCSAHPLATAVGIDILRKGGNAVDAAIAVQFALSVVYPNAGNIGGGGFFIYRDQNGEVITLDFREKAPIAATTDMYLDGQGNPIPESSLYGSKAAGVPGTVDGMIQIFEKYSKLKDWKLLVQPSIDLARNGYRITIREAKNLAKNQNLFKKYNRHHTAFEKEAWQPGEWIVQEDLAKTLEDIRDYGRDGFYKGRVAHLIVEEMKANGGIISLEDLSSYQSIWRKPLESDYRGYTIYSMPPPSSGGVALLQLLEMVELNNLQNLKQHSTEHIHLFTEVEKRVYADRAYYLGDPDFVQVPVKKLLDPNYLKKRMEDFSWKKSRASDSISYGVFESEETTHFNVVDQAGNAVAITTTLNGSYGSFNVVKGGGFLLNNEMDDFSIKPGFPNLYGLIGYEANKIEPRKRMLSSMTPCIVEKDGALFLLVGTPGGSTIITSVFQVITNIIDFQEELYDAVQAPRFHHQWKPDKIQMEVGLTPKVDTFKLKGMGHHVVTREAIGRVEAILVKGNKKLTIVADKRGDDDAKGLK